MMEKTKRKFVSLPYSISAVVMAFNECVTLEDVVSELDSELARLCWGKYEILIVDDGSTDGTGEIADHLEREYSEVRLIHHSKNMGLGAVYRTGFANGKYDFLTFYPADGQLPVSNINKFGPYMDDYDLILGYLEKSESSILGKFLSKAERMLIRLVFGKMPEFQGQFFLRKNVLDKIELRSDGRGWAIAMELIVRLSRGKYRIASVPIESRPRTSGKSKVNNIKTILSSLRQLGSLYRHI